MEAKTNWLAIAASVVVSMLMGFLWYGVLFQSQWMAGNGFTMEGDKMFKNGAEIPMTATPMIVNTVAMVVYALIMNWLLNKMNISTWQSGALAGGGIGLLMAFGILTGNMFAQNPMSLSLVDGSYSFLLFVLIGAIVGGWRKK
ncbi:MAG: DUF1761 domain-containing protein [Lewinellaceae bacterium]|nr:DUF1761 domain-containing protein [Lewinellaceae bacterium]